MELQWLKISSKLAKLAGPLTNLLAFCRFIARSSNLYVVSQVLQRRRRYNVSYGIALRAVYHEMNAKAWKI